jgi:glycosyltransferase 2 family protein
LKLSKWVKTPLISKYFHRGIGLLIAVISLYLATREVALIDVKNSLQSADLRFVGWAFASTLGIVLIRVFRWKILMGDAGVRIPLQRTLMAMLAGQALNLIYPARIGDLSRAYLVSPTGSNRVFMLGTVVLEKLLDSVAYLLLFALLVVVLPLPYWLSTSGYTFAIITLLSLGMVFLLMYRTEWFSELLLRQSNHIPEKFRDRIQAWMLSGFKSLEILKNRRNIVYLFLLSIVIWIIPILTNHLTLLALQIHLPLTASLLTMIVLQASVAIPSVPGRIGLFEYLCVISLSLFGISEGPAFTYGVLLHVIALLPSTLVGILFLWMLGINSGRSQASTITLEEHTD